MPPEAASLYYYTPNGGKYNRCPVCNYALLRIYYQTAVCRGKDGYVAEATEDTENHIMEKIDMMQESKKNTGRQCKFIRIGGSYQPVVSNTSDFAPLELGVFNTRILMFPVG